MRPGSVSVTHQHDTYTEQAKALLGRLTEDFETADRYIVLQSVPSDFDRELISFAREYNWQPHYASHDTDNLELYRESDLHVGYRKHGHLAHLR